MTARRDRTGISQQLQGQRLIKFSSRAGLTSIPLHLTDLCACCPASRAMAPAVRHGDSSQVGECTLSCLHTNPHLPLPLRTQCVRKRCTTPRSCEKKLLTTRQNPSFVLQKPLSLSFEDRPIPELESDYDVIVKPRWTGICGSDVRAPPSVTRCDSSSLFRICLSKASHYESGRTATATAEVSRVPPNPPKVHPHYPPPTTQP